jgi:phage gp36-like protein
MAYCTLTNLEAIKSAATLILWAGEEMAGTPLAGTGHASTAVTGAIITAADSIIDSKLGLRYSVPFSTVPEIIKTISMWIAMSMMCLRNLPSMPEDIQEGYNFAIGLLDNIAKGEAGLGVTAAASSLGPSIEVTTPYEHNKFDMNTFEKDGDPDFQTVDA